MRPRKPSIAFFSGRILAALILLALLASCASSAGEQPTLEQSDTATITASPTATATITSTSTWTPRPTRTSTPYPTRTPTTPPAVSFTPTLPQSPGGMFRVVLRLQEITPGIVLMVDIPPQPDQIVLVGSFGIVRIDLNTLETETARFFGASLGLDPSGRAWVIQPGGNVISAWIDNNWTDYDRFQGWVIPGIIPRTPVSSSTMIAGIENTLWLATATDVRRFENDYWTIYPAASIGITLPYKAGVQSALTLAASATTREAWVGSCNWAGRDIVGGSALRYFDGRRWLTSDFPLRSACVLSLHTAPDGSVWAVTDSDIWRYDTAAKEWQDFPLPALPESQIYNYPIDLVISPSSEPCPLMRITDKDGHPLQDIRYCLEGDKWQAVRTLPPPTVESLRFLPDGTMLSFEQGAVLLLQPDGKWKTIGEVDYAAFEAGPDSQIWLVSMVESRPIIWQADLTALK